jgi:hypothetical protein
MAPSWVERWPGLLFGLGPSMIHPLFASFYLVAAVAIFLQKPRYVLYLSTGLRIVPPEPPSEPIQRPTTLRGWLWPLNGDTLPPRRTPECASCPIRQCAEAALHGRQPAHAARQEHLS